MGALGAVELVGFFAGLGLLHGRVAVRVGDFGGFAEGGYDRAVHDGEDGREAEGNEEDVAVRGGVGG